MIENDQELALSSRKSARSPEFQFWNDWTPSSGPSDSIIKTNGPTQLYNLEKTTKDPKYEIFHKTVTSNWIPPTSLKKLSDFETVLSQQNCYLSVYHDYKSMASLTEQETFPYLKRENSTSLQWKSSTAINIGSQLHDVTALVENEIIHGVIDRSFLETAEIHKDKYGDVACFAKGEVGRVGSAEKSMIHINNPEHLRQLLQVSPSQWSALKECIISKNLSLRYNVGQHCDITKLNSFEKLWYLLCRRRHFLPAVVVHVKACGFVKLKNLCKVLPKLLVTDIKEVGESVKPQSIQAGQTM